PRTRIGHLIKRAFTNNFYVCTNALKPRRIFPVHAAQSPESRRRPPDRLCPRLHRGPGRTAGCTTVREEHASGADRSRPVLARLLRDIAAGDTLVVVRLDRLARSVSHL